MFVHFKCLCHCNLLLGFYSYEFLVTQFLLGWHLGPSLLLCFLIKFYFSPFVKEVPKCGPPVLFKFYFNLFIIILIIIYVHGLATSLFGYECSWALWSFTSSQWSDEKNRELVLLLYSYVTKKYSIFNNYKRSTSAISKWVSDCVCARVCVCVYS